MLDMEVKEENNCLNISKNLFLSLNILEPQTFLWCEIVCPLNVRDQVMPMYKIVKTIAWFVTHGCKVLKISVIGIRMFVIYVIIIFLRINYVYLIKEHLKFNTCNAEWVWWQ